jgi:hypothetical protein
MYVGQQFESCWQFAQKHFADRGLDLPDNAYDCHGVCKMVEQPQDGDLVLIDSGGHCGIYSDGGVLNYVPSFGVVKNATRQFYGQVTFYRIS